MRSQPLSTKGIINIPVLTVRHTYDKIVTEKYVTGTYVLVREIVKIDDVKDQSN